MDCLFCSLTRKAGLFTEKYEFPLEEVVAWAKQGEAEGADALNLMSTGTYPFSRLLEIGRRLSREVKVPLVANARDINHSEGEQLLDAGFVGFYHAVRLGEGIGKSLALVLVGPASKRADPDSLTGEMVQHRVLPLPPTSRQVRVRR